MFDSCFLFYYRGFSEVGACSGRRTNKNTIQKMLTKKLRMKGGSVK